MGLNYKQITKNILMKKAILIFVMLLFIVVLYSCKKKTDDTPTNTDNYSSTANFFAVNATPLQTFTVDATTGGSFTAAHGSIIIVPANAFKTQGGLPVSGNVSIKFKDVYKKSDMFLNKLTTEYIGGGPMKSAGMFYIKALQGANALVLSSGKCISVKMPYNGLEPDTQMKPYILSPDSNSMSSLWYPTYDSLVYDTTANYIYNLLQFYPPLDSGTWANCDHPIFTGIPTTMLTIHPLFTVADYQPSLCLNFNTYNTNIRIYSYGTDFNYSFAPIGVQCTLVAVGVKNGKLYSSFIPITISNYQTVNFNLTETTTDEFKAQLEAMN